MSWHFTITSVGICRFVTLLVVGALLGIAIDALWTDGMHAMWWKVIPPFALAVFLAYAAATT